MTILLEICITSFQLLPELHVDIQMEGKAQGTLYIHVYVHPDKIQCIGIESCVQAIHVHVHAYIVECT